MVAGHACAGWLRWAAIGLFVSVLAAGAAWASPPPEQEQLQAFLEAGEFAPALDLARQTTDSQQRDALLGQIVQAQASAGARAASLLSASEIGDDRARKKALDGRGAKPAGAQGGGAEPDFDSLIDLITSTIKPTSWDSVGGPGSIMPFPTGVWVDPQGTLRSVTPQEADGLAALRDASKPRTGQENVRRNSPMRMVSLPHLEKCVQLRLAAGQQPSEEMQVLAGLNRISCVFIYPDSGDIVLAGPAGDWTAGPEGAIVNADNGRPVLRLDDLVVIFRQMMSGPNAKFGCRITPREENLAKLQSFLRQSQRYPPKPEFRRAWLDSLRRQVGKQDIEVYGLDPRTRAAQVIVEADYRMKLVGMGLEAGVPGVVSYLKMVKVGPGQPPPPMTVLRWWFTLNYDAVQCSPDRLAFTLRGQGVKVESENEFLTAQGQQVHTGMSDELNRKFARSFTQHFEQLCDKYPVYGELRNIFELARHRRFDPRRGRRRQGRLAPDLLRRSASLSGGTDRSAERGRIGGELPRHRPHNHHRGRQRRREGEPRVARLQAVDRRRSRFNAADSAIKRGRQHSETPQRPMVVGLNRNRSCIHSRRSGVPPLFAAVGAAVASSTPQRSSMDRAEATSAEVARSTQRSLNMNRRQATSPEGAKWESPGRSPNGTSWASSCFHETLSGLEARLREYRIVFLATFLCPRLHPPRTVADAVRSDRHQ